MKNKRDFQSLLSVVICKFTWSTLILMGQYGLGFKIKTAEIHVYVSMAGKTARHVIGSLNVANTQPNKVRL